MSRSKQPGEPHAQALVKLLNDDQAGLAEVVRDGAKRLIAAVEDGDDWSFFDAQTTILKALEKQGARLGFSWELKKVPCVALTISRPPGAQDTVAKRCVEKVASNLHFWISSLGRPQLGVCRFCGSVYLKEAGQRGQRYCTPAHRKLAWDHENRRSPARDGAASGHNTR